MCVIEVRWIMKRISRFFALWIDLGPALGLLCPMALTIGIDSGTQSVKAVALDLDTRKVIAEARCPSPHDRGTACRIR